MYAEKQCLIMYDLARLKPYSKYLVYINPSLKFPVVTDFHSLWVLFSTYLFAVILYLSRSSFHINCPVALKVTMMISVRNTKEGHMYDTSNVMIAMP